MADEIKKIPGGSSSSKLILIFCLGFFSLHAQALLFRDFLSVFDGNELSIGLFFASWLIWVAAGALTARIKIFSSQRIVALFELAILAYIPAYAVQKILLDNMRFLAGVKVFEIFPLIKAVPMVFISNAPVSFCTGFLFVLACGWMKGTFVPPAKVYVF